MLLLNYAGSGKPYRIALQLCLLPLRQVSSYTGWQMVRCCSCAILDTFLQALGSQLLSQMLICSQHARTTHRHNNSALLQTAQAMVKTHMIFNAVSNATLARTRAHTHARAHAHTSTHGGEHGMSEHRDGSVLRVG